MSVTKRRRLGAIGAASALIASFLAFGASPAAADTTQSLACFSPLTSTYSTFPLPMTGTGAPSPINPGEGATFSDLSTAFGINSALVVAGIGAGVLTFVTDPALLGSVDPLSGGNGVNAASNTTTARYSITNANPATHTANGAVNAEFWIVWDGVNPAAVQIYVEDSPGSWSGSGTTGLHVVPSLVIPIPLSPAISVTHVVGGSPINLSISLGPLPANPGGAPTVAERNAAPARVAQQPRRAGQLLLLARHVTGSHRPDHESPRLVGRVLTGSDGQRHRLGHRYGSGSGARRE